MPKRAEPEIKVGIFVLIGLAILTAFVLSITEFYSLLGRGKLVKVTFGYADGVEVGAPVRLAGVEIGEVKEVEVISREEGFPLAEVSLWIRGEVKIPEGSDVRINSLGLLGEKYIEILPAVSSGRFVQDGQTLRGHDPISMEELKDLVRGAVLKLEETVGAVNRIVGDEEIRVSFRQTVKNSRQLSDSLNELSDSARELIDKVNAGEGSLGKLVSDDELYYSLQSLIEDLREHPWKLLHRPRERSRRR